MFKNMVKTMLAISLIPVVLLGVLSYHNASRGIEHQVMTVNRQLLVQTRLQFEQTLDVIYNYYVLLGNKSNVRQTLEADLNYQDMMTILDIQGQLMALQNLQSIVQSAALISLRYDWMISDDNFYTQIPDSTKRIVEKQMNHSDNIAWTYRIESEPDVSLFIKMPYNKPYPYGALMVRFRYDQIQNFFLEALNHDIVVLDEQNRIVFSENLNQVGETFLDAFDFDGMYEETKGYYRAFLDTQRMGVLYETSSYNGWTYVMLYDLDSITEEVTPIRNITIFLVLILCGVIFVMAILGSRRLYKPVRSIYQDMRQGENNRSDEKVDEVSYIQDGIHNLIERQVKMQNQLEKQILQVEELFLLKLLKGELSMEQIQQRANNIGKFNRYQAYAVMSFRISQVMSSEDRTKDEEWMIILLFNALQEGLRAMPYLTPIIRQGRVVVLVDDQEQDTIKFKEKLFCFAKDAQENVKKRLNADVQVGISNRYSNPLEIPVALKESLEAIRFHTDKEDVILFYEDVKPGQVIRVVYPKHMEDEMLMKLDGGAIEEAERLLEGLLDQIFTATIEYQEQQIYVNRLLIAIVNVAQDAGIPISSFSSPTDNMMEAWMQITHLDELKIWFRCKVLRPMMPLLEAQRSNKHHVIIKAVTKIIEAEYDQDISLETVAARLNYHPSYIWKMMKQELGMSFTDYLLDYRLAQAKKLLIETDQTVGMIAEQLRYTNAQNFIRYFKNREGMTPGKYRKMKT